MKNTYDFIIAGAGLFGATCASELKKKGFKVLVLDKRNHVGGNIYTEEKEGINVHVYGAHIFHTSNKEVWDCVNDLVPFNNFINSPVANYKGEMYNLPFNMNTFAKLWPGVVTPEDAKNIIEKEKAEFKVENPKNLEEQAINLVGKTVYEKLIKGYTAKQWGRPCDELPSFIIKRVPVRFTYNNNYFNDIYQGIPIGGYTKLIDKLLEGIDVQLNTNFLDKKEEYLNSGAKIIYTGPIDEFFDYKFGPLEYRSLRFESEVLDQIDHQGVAVVNYTDSETPFTRIIEHKHFESCESSKTIITREYPATWKLGDEPYYPVNNDKNAALFEKYLAESKEFKNLYFGGRLGLYKYYDMDKTIIAAFDLLKNF